MTLTINTNISSLVAQHSLNGATSQLNQAIERMTTGYKINHAGDNAAGYSIARSWEAQLGSLDVAADNAATGADMLSTLEDNYALISKHIQRVRDLTEQASNGTYGSQSKLAIKSEIVARLEEINRIADNCEFSGQYMMNGSLKDKNIAIQVGTEGTASKSQIALKGDLFKEGDVKSLFTIDAVTKEVDDGEGGTETQTLVPAYSFAAALDTPAKVIDKLANDCAGLGATYTTTAGVTTQDVGTFTAAQMLVYVDDVINIISDRVTTLGAAQNRIESAIESIGVQTENITSSLSTLRDADVAQESSNYLRAQILQQASATLLATANQTPSIALNLL